MSFTSYVALGDSFTEGVGDPDPSRPNGLRGWSERVADVLAAQQPGFRYANLAIRGRKIPEIVAEQLPAALTLGLDAGSLVTLNGGGNDVLRPNVDIDGLAALLDEATGSLAATGATVVLFTLPDTRSNQAFSLVRGRIALFNEFVREVADHHGAVIVDIWRDHDYDRRVVLDSDRLHLNAAGHQGMAIQVLDAIGAEHALLPLAIEPPTLTPRERLAEDAEWVRTFLLPWVGRRLTGRSSGDGIVPKYAELTALPTEG